MHPSNEVGEAGVGREMPRYKSHKEVWALEIEGLAPLCGSGNISMAFKDAGFANIEFASDDDIFARYKPVAGDFYVVYTDGYKSFSPRKAFLEGYSRDEPNAVELGAAVRRAGLAGK